VHDTVAWNHPESLGPRRVAWHKAMAKRAQRYADAVVVPTHAVADGLSEVLDFGDRIRVIAGAVSSRFSSPLGRLDADARAARLALPEEYLVTTAGLETRRGIRYLLESLARPDSPDLPLLVVGPDHSDGESLAALVAEVGLRADRVRVLGTVDDDDYAVVLGRATALVFPSLDEGFGYPVLEGFHFGVPVIHSDAPALLEVAGGAGIAVERHDFDGYPERLAAAMTRVASDRELANTLSTTGRDRAGLFSWRTAAEKTWQLHAEL
jgi:glycosyltransferase involved in cell wall biosynthesis